MNSPPCAFRAQFRCPRFYRYRVADGGFRLVRNRYKGQFGAATIGVALVISGFAYCVMWADPVVVT